MTSRRIQRAKTSAAVVDYLLEQVFEGRLRSGDRIDLDGVAEELGVSRIPVREALVILERDGIVSSLPHRGSFIEPFDAESIIDDFEILGLLSGVAVARLARQRDPDVIEELEALLRELEATPPEDVERVAHAVQELVRAQHRAGGSRRLRAELSAYGGFLPWAFRLIDRPHEETLAAHANVVRSIKAGEPDEAARHRVEDFRAAGRSVASELARRGVLDEPA